MTDRIGSYQMDKTTLSVATVTAQDRDDPYWHTQPPHERLRALEFLRQVMYGYDSTTARLQRVFAVREAEISNYPSVMSR